MIQRVKSLSASPRFPWVLIGIGILLRLVHYLHSCSLSVDESHLALQILGRTHAQLLEPLDERQGAPLAFLQLLKAVTEVFGESEYALRLIAFLSGVVSLFLFKPLAERYLSPAAVTLAVGLFAFTNNLIFYSAQVKQYSSDVMFVLILLLLAEQLPRRARSLRFLLLYALIGTVALWFSHAAVFVLAGLALTAIYHDIVRPERDRSFGLLLPFAVWGLNFLVIYKLSLRSLAGHEWLLNFWKDDFMPFPPRSMMDVQWYIVAFFQMFSRMLGFSLQGICALPFLVGCYALAADRRRRLANLILPILLALAASGLHKYPFCCRLILFTAPALLLLMAEGARSIVASLGERKLVAATFLGLLFLHPVMWAGYHLLEPRYEEEIKPQMRYLRDHRQPGDVIYVYYRAIPAFTYYARRFGLDPQSCCIHGIDSRYDWNGYERDLTQLRGNRRVWVLFAHIYTWVNVDDEVLFQHFLNNLGTQLDHVDSHGAALYLYDLSSPPPGKGAAGGDLGADPGAALPPRNSLAILPARPIGDQQRPGAEPCPTCGEGPASLADAVAARGSSN